MKKSTIVDVAKLAGTSVPTVSRVLNGSDHPIKDSTRENVIRAAKELGYKPNQFARAIKGKHTNNIGVLVPSITNPFYSQIISSIQTECFKHGYIPIICASNNNPELEKEYIDILEEEKVAGLLISCISWNKELNERMGKLEIPFVLFDQVPDGFLGDYVGFDFAAAGAMAATIFELEGHSDIVLATGPLNRISRKQFCKGFIDSTNSHNLKKQIIEIDASNDDYETGEMLARKLLELDKLPSAVVAINDMTAIGIIRELTKQGINVPNDISLLGFDDIPHCTMITPTLSTIKQPCEKTGIEAMDILISKISGNALNNTQIRFSPELIKRESIRKIHSKVWRNTNG